MAKTWNDFISLVAVDVPGCPPLVMREALKESVASFCDQTACWSEDLDPISLAEGVRDYDLLPSTGARVLVLQAVKYKGLPLLPFTDQDMDVDLKTWLTSPSGSPSTYQLVQDDGAQMLRLFPTPSADEEDALDVRVTLKPASDAETLPEWFYEEWRSVLASGALAILCAVPAKAWSNSELAVYHRRLFHQGITKAVARQAAGGTNKILTARPVRFG